MQAAIDASTESWSCELRGQSSEQGTWLAQTIYRNPSNRERVLALDPQLFADTMRRWGTFFLSMSWPAGLTEVYSKVVDGGLSAQRAYPIEFCKNKGIV